MTIEEILIRTAIYFIGLLVGYRWGKHEK